MKVKFLKDYRSGHRKGEVVDVLEPFGKAIVKAGVAERIAGRPLGSKTKTTRKKGTQRASKVSQGSPDD